MSAWRCAPSLKSSMRVAGVQGRRARADAEGDVREVILKFLPDSPVGEDYGGDRDVGDDGIAVLCGGRLHLHFRAWSRTCHARDLCVERRRRFFSSLAMRRRRSSRRCSVPHTVQYIKGQHRFAQALKALGEHEAAEHHEAGLRHLP